METSDIISTINPLLHRIEISGKIIFSGATPSNSDVAAVVAKETKKDVVCIVVKHIGTKFGQQEASFSAYAYDSPEVMMKVEESTKHLKKKAEEAKKAAKEKKKEAETKVEEKKEETVEEKKEAAETSEVKEEAEATKGELDSDEKKKDTNKEKTAEDHKEESTPEENKEEA
jgi:small subunit ribosomal protein S24e